MKDRKKCEHCKFLNGEISSIGIACTNPNRKFRRSGIYNLVAGAYNDIQELRENNQIRRCSRNSSL